MTVVQSDILIIGGGIAGCFAAIKASEMGKSVALLDKATIRRGGSVGPGMDHISIGVHPEAMTLEEAKISALKNRKELYDPNVMLACDVHAYERIKDFEKYGVHMQEDDGSYRIWKIPERHSYFLSYRGVDTKVKLAEAVKKTKTKIFERTMGVELLKHDGRVVGAVAINTRTGELTTFLAKATILATGEPGRQYIEPDGPFMTYYPITNTGDAEAMAYRAGAKLANMEFTYVDYTLSRAGGGIPGIKPFEKLGKYVNRFGDSFINSLEDSKKRVFLMVKEVMEGRGPIYIDLRGLPEDVIREYEREMEHEYPITIEWFKQRNLDFRKDLIPIQLIPAGIHGGPIIDETLKTSVPGLYAAGAATAFVMGLGRAAVTGHIA
ncbi:MAG TPA: FAD-dependent oxidoreductase, partial [Atribacterota bacterium]|nr:FAD-dependent oxidoreductase [Atribacterota bacterium]